MQPPKFTQPFDFSAVAQDSANAGREGVEAFIKSSTIFAKGMEELVQTATKLAQTNAEKQAQFTKELMASKTLNEMAETQNKIAQAHFNAFVANSTKLSELSAKLLTEASEPINKQMTKTINAAQKKAA